MTAPKTPPVPADFGELTDFFEDDGFFSPPMPSTAHPEGSRYHVPSPDAQTGLRMNALAELMLKQQRGIELSELDVKRLRLDDTEEREFVEQALSVETVDLMVADGVKFVHMKRLATYAFTYFAISKEAADNAVANGLFSGKAQTPTNRAQRRQAGANRTAGSPASKSTTRKR